jgi:hypothetical protein
MTYLVEVRTRSIHMELPVLVISYLNPRKQILLRRMAPGSGTRVPRAKRLLERVVAFPDLAQSFVGSPIGIPEWTICLLISSEEKPARKTKVPGPGASHTDPRNQRSGPEIGSERSGSAPTADTL